MRLLFLSGVYLHFRGDETQIDKIDIRLTYGPGGRRQNRTPGPQIFVLFAETQKFMNYCGRKSYFLRPACVCVLMVQSGESTLSTSREAEFMGARHRFTCPRTQDSGRRNHGHVYDSRSLGFCFNFGREWVSSQMAATFAAARSGDTPAGIYVLHCVNATMINIYFLTPLLCIGHFAPMMNCAPQMEAAVVLNRIWLNLILERYLKNDTHIFQGFSISLID